MKAPADSGFVTVFGWLYEIAQAITEVRKGMDKLEPSCVVGGLIKRLHHFEN